MARPPPITCVIVVAARLMATACAEPDEAGAHPRPFAYREPRNGRVDALVAG